LPTDQRPVRLTKQHAELLGDRLDQPSELFRVVVNCLEHLLEVSALSLSPCQLFRLAAIRGKWADMFVELLCAADQRSVEQLALSLIELRTV
jgi:hypothetical protein